MQVRSPAGVLIGTIETHARYVVGTPRLLATVADARRFQDAVDRSLLDAAATRLVLDARDVPMSDDAVNTSMWSWTKNSTAFDALAIVNKSQALSVSVKMRSLTLPNKRVATFDTLLQALRWLHSGSK